MATPDHDQALITKLPAKQGAPRHSRGEADSGYPMESRRSGADSVGNALLLTTVEAAARLRISPRQLRNLVAWGEIRPTRIGRSVRFLPAELEQYVLRITYPERKIPVRPHGRRGK